MRVDDLKKEAIEKIGALNDEKLLKEILDHLQQIQEGNISLASHYNSIKKQYGAVLEKLAK